MAVRLKHLTKHHALQKHYFYEGHAVAVNGVIEIPANRPAWAQRIYKLGYMLDPETDRRLSLGEVLGLFSAKSTPTPVEETPAVTPEATPEATPVLDENAKSEENTDETNTTADTTTDVVAEPVAPDATSVDVEQPSAAIPVDADAEVSANNDVQPESPESPVTTDSAEGLLP
jgi:hypothetical protein